MGALILMLALAAAPAGDPAALPPEGFQGGWNRLAPPKVWPAADLYGFIDGGADLFLEFGFEAVTVQTYVKGDDEFSVELYRMTDPTAALGIYLAKCGEETPDPSLGERHTLGRYQLALTKGRYYLILNNESGKTELIPDLLAFAHHISAHLPEGKAPDLFAPLPPAGRLPGSLRLVRGPLALQSLFTLGPGDILSLGGKVTASAASYADATRIVVDYPSPAAATGAFRHLADHLDPYLKPLSRQENRLVFEDFAHEFGCIELAGSRMTITLGLTVKPATSS